jgi:LytS/YehU family sensor histidine kinase
MREKQALQQSVLAREAELRALRAQVHPHFLFNSLNSISALTTANPNNAREMSIRLANFLRKTLKFGGSDHVTVMEEIALVEDYLSIEKIRFGERLMFEKDIDPGVLPCLVPPLILQPLVENAVNHGIAHIPEGGTIRLRAAGNDQTLRITVDSPVDPDYVSPRKGGLGLENIRKRLEVTHGSGGKLRTEMVSGRFIAEITAPITTEKGPVS